jgi:DNA-binding transcriptional regulator YiaG
MTPKTLEKVSLRESIKTLRKQLKLNQEETAHVLGVTVTTLSRWATQRTAEPDPAHQEKVERLLSMSQQAAKVIKPAGLERWFKTPHPLLLDLRPLDLLRSAPGLEKVRSLLNSMEWGLPV